jgi:hypothetical protein
MMAATTEAVQRSAQPHLLPTITLLDELHLFVERGGAWLQEAPIVRAVERLRPIVAQVGDPLVFTNGDYQPANFLTDGLKVTGIVDFEYAHYGDFLLGFAKYPIYDLHPLYKAGMIPCLLENKSVPYADFAVRLAIGCLKTLQREIPLYEGDSVYRNHVLALLEQSLESIVRD